MNRESLGIFPLPNILMASKGVREKDENICYIKNLFSTRILKNRAKVWLTLMNYSKCFCERHVFLNNGF